jgi:hypothetical protein
MFERCLKAHGLNRFFGMNVLVETIGLSLFGLLADKPGLEVLRLFHLDESRHTALPNNYLKEFPLSERQQRAFGARLERFLMVVPALPLVLFLEPELAELGVDAFDFGGSVLRKVVHLAERSGFFLLSPGDESLAKINEVFNRYCAATRPGHVFKNFMASETTRGAAEVAVEREVFGGSSDARAIARAA